MATLLSPLIRGQVSVETSDLDTEATTALNFSVRAPIGIVVRGWTLWHRPQAAVAATNLRLATVISMDPSLGGTIDFLSDIADVANLDALISTAFEDAAAASMSAMQKSVMLPDLPLEMLPITFEAVSIGGRVNGIQAGLTVEHGMLVYYQLARFTDSEIAATIATRP